MTTYTVRRERPWGILSGELHRVNNGCRGPQGSAKNNVALSSHCNGTNLSVGRAATGKEPTATTSAQGIETHISAKRYYFWRADGHCIVPLGYNQKGGARYVCYRRRSLLSSWKAAPARPARWKRGSPCKRAPSPVGRLENFPLTKFLAQKEAIFLLLPYEGMVQNTLLHTTLVICIELYLIHNNSAASVE